jgi:hypothetical protein
MPSGVVAAHLECGGPFRRRFGFLQNRFPERFERYLAMASLDDRSSVRESQSGVGATALQRAPDIMTDAGTRRLDAKLALSLHFEAPRSTGSF